MPKNRVLLLGVLIQEKDGQDSILLKKLNGNYNLPGGSYSSYNNQYWRRNLSRLYYKDTGIMTKPIFPNPIICSETMPDTFRQILIVGLQESKREPKSEWILKETDLTWLTLEELHWFLTKMPDEFSPLIHRGLTNTLEWLKFQQELFSNLLYGVFIKKFGKDKKILLIKHRGKYFLPGGSASLNSYIDYQITRLFYKDTGIIGYLTDSPVITYGKISTSRKNVYFLELLEKSIHNKPAWTRRNRQTVWLSLKALYSLLKNEPALFTPLMKQGLINILEWAESPTKNVVRYLGDIDPVKRKPLPGENPEGKLITINFAKN